LCPPLILAAIVLGWIIGFLMGVHSTRQRLAQAFGTGDARLCC